MKIPEKPQTLDEQVSMIWDAVFNHIFHRLKFQDIKINFILTFLGLMIAILVVMLTLKVIG